ncbi:MAG TPA: hypothetical protein VF807_01855 [Ktedonobacterales bacterium]
MPPFFAATSAVVARSARTPTNGDAAPCDNGGLPVRLDAASM